MARDLSDDFEVLDRYQAFSTELARLSLLGIGAIGFLLVGGPNGVPPALLPPMSIHCLTKVALLVALIGFASACSFSLSHRYWSTDSIACLKKLTDLRQAAERDEGKIEAEYEAMERAFHKSTWLIAASATALGVGAVALAVVFASALL